MKYNSKGSQIVEKYIESKQECCFSALDVCEYIKDTGIQVNSATVYRNLERLTKEGKLLKFKSATSDSHLYQYVGAYQNCSEHLHMRCRSCGKIYHLEGTIIDNFSKQISEAYGFEIEFPLSSLNGLCKECQNKL